MREREIFNYNFCIPNCGGFVKNIIQGRKEIINLLKRKQWKEILKEVMEI
jgi:hypothetical protein